MNYEEARDRLAKPRFKESKKLGHKTYLEREFHGKEDGTSEVLFKIRYFNTHILIFYPTGEVQIRDGGWLTSTCTIQKINEYLPRGWRLSTTFLKYLPKSKVGVLEAHDTKSHNSLWSVPYADQVMYHQDSGRCGYPRAALKHSAYDLITKIGDYVWNTVDDFLNGRLHSKDVTVTSLDELVESVGEEPQREDLTLMVLQGQVRQASLVASVIKHGLSLPYRHIAPSYWGECFQFTDARKNKNLKQRIKEMSYQMVHEDLPLRYLGNSSGFFSLRDVLHQNIEKLLIKWLGFDTYLK
jgi:hypothetical protein